MKLTRPRSRETRAEISRSSRARRTESSTRTELRSRWARRDDRYSELRTEATARQPKVEMFRLGG